MAYGQEHTEELPTVGATEGEEFATMINAVIEEMRTTLDAKVTPAGIDINSDLSFRSGSTYSGLTNVHRVSLYAQSLLSAATYPVSLYANPSGNLYYNDSSGNQIALTSAGTIAGSAGSISGSGYGSSGVEVAWDSGSEDYLFYSAASTFADIHCADLLLDDGSSNTIRVQAPAMSADYTLTLPSAVPASNGTLLQMATTGTVTAANTSLASITMTANNHVTVSGTGQFKHGSRTMVIPGSAFMMPNPATDSVELDTADSGYVGIASNTDRTLIAPIPLPAGKRITAISWYVHHGSSGDTRTYGIRAYTLASHSGASSTSNTDTTNGANVTVTTGSLTITLAAGVSYFLTGTLVTTNDQIYGVEITYDEP